MTEHSLRAYRSKPIINTKKIRRKNYEKAENNGYQFRVEATLPQHSGGFHRLPEHGVELPVGKSRNTERRRKLVTV